MTTGNNTVEARLSRLERTNRFLLLGVAILGSVTLIAVSMPRKVAVLRAERFELIDSLGQVHATLEISKAGETGLFILDDSSRVRISLAHDREQTALFIRDTAGDTRLGVAQFSHGGGGFALHGQQMKGAAVLYMKDRRGSLRMFDEQGDMVYQVPE